MGKGQQAPVSCAHPNLVMMGLYLGAFVGMFGETSLNIALPALVEAFGVDVSLMQWMVVGHMLVIGLVLPFSSLLMKWFPVRKLVVFALGVFIIGSLMSGFANSFPLLLAGRMVQGFGPGLILPIMFALVVQVFPPSRIGAAMGLCSLIVMFAPAIGPTLAGFILAYLSWRWVFFTYAIILAVALAFALRYMVNPYAITKPRIDVPSCALSVFGFGGLVAGVGLASLYGWLSAACLGSLAVGIVCLAVYVRRQLVLEVPVLNMRVFAIKGFTVGALCVMLAFGITMSSMYLMPQYIQRGMLVAVAVAGLVLLPGGCTNAVFSLIGGRLYDRVGARGPALCGFLLALLGTALLLTTDENTSLAFIVLCHVILLAGVPLAMAPSQTNALDSLPYELSTDGSAVLNTMQQVWGAVCTAIATSLLGIGSAAFTGTDPTGALAFTNGFHYGLYFTLALAVLGVAAALGLRSGRRAVAPSAAADAKFVPLRAIMETDVYAVSAGESLIDALRFLADKGISGAPVVDAAGKPVGFISDGDILRHLAISDPLFTSAYSLATVREAGHDAVANVSRLLDIKVSEVCTRDLISVDVHDELDEICRVLQGRHLRKAPVMENGQMVGIVNRSNISKYALEMYLEETQGQNAAGR